MADFAVHKVWYVRENSASQQRKAYDVACARYRRSEERLEVKPHDRTATYQEHPRVQQFFTNTNIPSTLITPSQFLLASYRVSGAHRALQIIHVYPISIKDDATHLSGCRNPFHLVYDQTGEVQPFQ